MSGGKPVSSKNTLLKSCHLVGGQGTYLRACEIKNLARKKHTNLTCTESRHLIRPQRLDKVDPQRFNIRGRYALDLRSSQPCNLSGRCIRSHNLK